MDGRAYNGTMVRNETPVFGRIPRGATHWSIRKRGDYAWEWCTFAGRDGVAQQEFGIADLSVALIRKRWGEGTYRVMFLSHTSGTRQVFGNGKVFELVGSNQSGTPKPTGRATPEAGPAPAEQTADHSDMVRALLLSAQGQSGAKELFEALAIPTGIGLSSLFSFEQRANDRLDAIERRLAALEERLGAAAPAPALSSAPLDRVLDKLEALEARLTRAAAPQLGAQPIGAIRPIQGRRRSSPLR